MFFDAAAIWHSIHWPELWMRRVVRVTVPSTRPGAWTTARPLRARGPTAAWWMLASVA
jgi:hypothetical protein